MYESTHDAGPPRDAVHEGEGVMSVPSDGDAGLPTTHARCPASRRIRSSSRVSRPTTVQFGVYSLTSKLG